MSSEFTALGHAGSTHYTGLETFQNPGVAEVEMNSDEFTAVCPVTGQPDLYTVTIIYRTDPDHGCCIESKSLKLYLGGFRNSGHFVETLAVKIHEDVKNALQGEEGPYLNDDDVEVEIVQKRRGGIEIVARTARS